MSREIIIAIFPSRMLLTNALDHITNVRDVAIQRAAIVAKAASGETVVLDDTLGAMEGGIAGGIAGGTLVALGLVQLGALTIPTPLAVLAMAFGIIFGTLLGIAVGRFAAQLINISFRSLNAEALTGQIQVGKPALILQIKNDEAMLSRLMKELNRFQAEYLPKNDENTSHLDRVA